LAAQQQFNSSVMKLRNKLRLFENTTTHNGTRHTRIHNEWIINYKQSTQDTTRFTGAFMDIITCSTTLPLSLKQQQGQLW